MDAFRIVAAYVVMEGVVLAMAGLFLVDSRRSTRRERLRESLKLVLEF